MFPRVRVLFFLGLLCNVVVFQSDVMSRQAEEPWRVCSHFEAMSINAAALRQGDVLIRCRETFDTVNRRDGINENGIVRFGGSWQRVVFDHDTREYCVLEVRVVTETNLAKMEVPGGPEQKSVTRYGKSVDRNGQLAIRSFPGEAKTRQLDESLDELFVQKAIGFPDYRSFGLFLGGMPGSFDSMIRGNNQLKTGSEFYKAEEIAADKMLILMRSEPNPEYWLYDEYTFDTVKLIPLARYQFLKQKTERVGELPAFASRQSFKWMELAGIQLPKSGHSEVPKIEMINGKEQNARLFTDIDFHWFSVNERIEPKWFDGSQFADFEAFKKLLDPEACGATELVESMK